jgi:hypothetical protein
VELAARNQRDGHRIDELIRGEHGLPVGVVACHHAPYAHAGFLSIGQMPAFVLVDRVGSAVSTTASSPGAAAAELWAQG